jgi:hypothetical protein
VLGRFREGVLLDDEDPARKSHKPTGGERDHVCMVEVRDQRQRPCSPQVPDEPWQGRKNAARAQINDCDVGRNLRQSRALGGSEHEIDLEAASRQPLAELQRAALGATLRHRGGEDRNPPAWSERPPAVPMRFINRALRSVSKALRLRRPV